MRFTLTIFEDGRALLTTPDDLAPDTAKAISDAWDHWKKTDKGMAVIASCEVQHAASVEIELPV